MKAFRTMPKKELLRGIDLCLRNARSLLKEADLLAKARARQRAFALSVLAMEEMGKAVLLTIASHSDRATASDQTLQALTKVFRNHNTKLALQAEQSWKGVLYVRRRKPVPGAELSYRRLLAAHMRVIDFLEAIKIKDTAALKLQALYVDVDNARRQFRPPPEIPGRVLSALLRIARSGIKDVVRLRDTFRRARGDGLAEAIAARMFKSETLEELRMPRRA